ncbi:hypothetical protein J2Y63_005615 [Shinella sp. BE166]
MGKPSFLLDFSHQTEIAEALSAERLERFIGVIYRPESERLSHYAYAELTKQFDAYVWFDETMPWTRDGARLQFPQNAIATRLFEAADHVDFVPDTSHIACGRRLGLHFRLSRLPRSEQVELLLHATYLALTSA